MCMCIGTHGKQTGSKEITQTASFWHFYLQMIHATL